MHTMDKHPYSMHEKGNGRGPMEGDADEKRPFTSLDTDGEIHIREPKKKKGCFVPCSVCVVLILCVLVLLALIGVIVYLMFKTPCGCEDTLKAGVGALSDNTSIAPTYTYTPKATVPPNLPWSGIRLPRDIIPSKYDLELRVDLNQFIFTGSVEITFRCHRPTYYIILHVNALDITEREVSVITLGRVSAILPVQRRFAVPENQFYVIEMVHMLQQGEYKVHVGQFRGELLDDLRGLYRSTYKDRHGRDRYLAVSQLQSVDARKVFPCLDEPDLKANFTVAITHQIEYVSISNMPLQKSTRLERGQWVRDQYFPTPPMSTYLLAFVVADFNFRDSILSDGLKVQIYCQPDKESQAQYALEFAGQVYHYFKDYFQTAEVVPKADHVAVPDFSAGAMENWGLVLYRETALLHDEQDSSISNKYWVSLIMAHEIAHSWFGNMVTMKWWDDLWLNEGFANTLMYFALDGIYSDWNVYDLQLVDNVYPVMTKDSLLTSHAISTPIIDPDDIPQYFDSISYDKGMAVLRLLRGFLGWTDFQAGLRMYIQRYKFRNAEMTQLWETFSEAVGNRHNVSEIMDSWTRQMGFPVVTVTHSHGNTYRVTQRRFLLNPDDRYDPSDSPYGYTWEIPFYYRVAGQSKEQSTWLHKTSGYNCSKAAETEIQVNGRWVLGNSDYMGFYRTNYDAAMWRHLIEQLHVDHTVFSTANRAGLISDAFNLARANLLDYGIALNLSSYLHKEDDYVPWRAFLDSIHFLQGMLSTSKSYGLLQTYIHELVAPQYRKWGTSDQGDLLERNLRRVLLEAATDVGVPDAVDWAQRAFRSWMDYDSRLPPDYAVVIYSVGIQYGGEEEWDYLWQRAHETRVASQSEIMMSALACTQQPWLLWRFARWTLDGNKVRQQDVRNHFRYYANTPLGRMIALDFLLTNWDEINSRYGEDSFLIRDVIQATTSLVNTEFEYNQLRTLYKDRPPAGVASKAADNSLALIRSNIKWLNLNHDTIHRWLTNHDSSRT